MAELPSASVVIDDEAGAFAGGTGYVVVVGCVEKNDDATPRVFASTKALIAQHGYSPLVDYCAMHFEATKKPVIVIGIPTATDGVVTDDDAGVIGTSVVVAAVGAAGVLDEVDGILTVTKPGIIGTTGATFDLSLDGGRTVKSVRLGAANTYVVPYLGITINFGAGTLLLGDVYTFTTTAPMWDGAGLTSARGGLAAQLKQARSIVVVGDIATSAFAGYVTTEANAYETANDRFVYARVNVRDRAKTGETMAAWVALMDTAFASVDSQKRIDLGLGRLRKTSPITGWNFRRPVSWAASIREYQHDVQIPNWRKSDGPLDGWSAEDADGNIVEYDERIDGGGLAARFTVARSYSNGPRGAFIALSLTRAPEGSLLSRTHNMAVVDLCCSVTQAETENAIGQVLVLKENGTGSDASLQIIESRVNTQLEIALLQSRLEGPRASKAVWHASRTDILNIPAAELTGYVDLELNGTLERVSTRVRIQTAGAGASA